MSKKELAVLKKSIVASVKSHLNKAKYFTAEFRRQTIEKPTRNGTYTISDLGPGLTIEIKINGGEHP